MTKDILVSNISMLRAHCTGEVPSGACDKMDRSKCWMQHDHKSVLPVTHDQLTSLTALIAYIAHTTNKPEFRVEREVSNHFCIPNIKCLPAQMYDEAMRHLVNLVPLQVANA